MNTNCKVAKGDIVILNNKRYLIILNNKRIPHYIKQ